MSYRFKKGDRNVQAGVRRIARKRLEAAIACIGPQPTAEDIHAFRKETKKLRALLRLVKPRIKGFRKLDGRLRDAAALVAPLRDAEVRLATFDRLAGQLDPADIAAGAEPEALAGIRAVLVAELEHRRNTQASGEVAQTLRAALEALRKEMGALTIKGRGFDALAEGLGNEWRKARRGMKDARRSLGRDFDAAVFHQWRKAVKRSWYHAELLRPLWPAMMEPHAKAADDLGEVLGLHNDFAVLAERLEADDIAGPFAAPVRALGDAILRERRVLAEEALAQGAAYLADSGKVLTKRWHRWWAGWRD